MSIVQNIEQLARRKHDQQFRKGNASIPYIEHPRAVVQRLLLWGIAADTDTIAAAWGHDLLEDTDASNEEILQASDAVVLQYIKILTKPENLSKEKYLKNVASCGVREVLLIKTADRLCNTEDFVALSGYLRAFRYLHSADCIHDALLSFADDFSVKKALTDWDRLKQLILDEAHKDAIRGCLLGGAIGDAMGAPVEFLAKEAIYQRYGTHGVEHFVEFGDEGAITDDTQMTLFTAEGILRANTRVISKGICDPVGIVYRSYLRWLYTQTGKIPCDRQGIIDSGWLIKEKGLYSVRAPGNTCLSALERIQDNPASNHPLNDSKGCGSVMRMAPVGLFFDPELAFEYGCKFSAITHGHPTGIIAGGTFAMLISLLYQGKTLSGALERLLDFLSTKENSAETVEAIHKAMHSESIADLGEGWVAEEALSIGIFAALKHPNNFSDAVAEAVNIDGDSDSTGSIAGNIIGVVLGEKAIPPCLVSKLREASIIRRIADDLFMRCQVTVVDQFHSIPTEEWMKKYPGA